MDCQALETGAIPHDVEISLCRLDDDGDIALAAASRWLSPDETARAARFRFARDRDRFVRGRGFLRRSLARRLGCNPRALALDAGPRGKPRLAGEDLAFNLSHSGGLAALAVATEHEVGIDIELVSPSPALSGNLASLVEACFLQDEAEAIAAAPLPQRAFLRFWTAKEARMKLTGEGLALEPRRIALAHANGRPLAYLAPDSPAASLHPLDLSGAVGTLALGPGKRTCCVIH